MLHLESKILLKNRVTEFRLITTLFELDPAYWKKIQSEKRGPKKGTVYSKCRNCMEEFPNMKELDRHLATLANCSNFSRRKKETEQKCEHCGKSFSYMRR